MNQQVSSYYGPGVWFVIHITAYNVKTENDKREFVKLMESIQLSFPCLKCRKHMTEYFNSNQIIRYWNVPNGMFKWSWTFHNAVNYRLGKNPITYDDALKLYSGDSDDIHICNEGCNDSTSINSDSYKSISRQELILKPNYRRR
jgi:hypothetical protein